MHQGGQVPGEQPDEPFRPAPPGVFGGEVRYPDARAGADAIRQQHDETKPQRRGAQRRQVAEPAEGGERPGDAQRRQQHGPNAQEPPEPESEPTPPAARHRSAQEGQAEEDADRERPDPDQLLAPPRVHVIRRSAYWGTTPKRSCFAAKATSSPRFASTSWPERGGGRRLRRETGSLRRRRRRPRPGSPPPAGAPRLCPRAPPPRCGTGA